LLNNAEEYGQADHARITIDMEGDLLRVTFEDNGDGFEIGDTLASKDAERLGLATMRERIEMLEGDIYFDSDPGRGTRVDFELPIS
jgi:two-component system sensor histidine kinase DegS